MNLTEFFNTIKKYGDGSFSIPVLKEFLTTPNKPDLTNFFDLYKQDKKLASAVDSKKYAKVIGKILEDHKSFGGDPTSITSALQKNPDKMTISSMDIRNINLLDERMHKFTINVSGVLLYDVVEKIYDFAKELNYDLDMEIPAAKDQKLGYTDTIILYSSNNNLFNTLDFIQKVKTISNSFGEQPKYRDADGERKSFYAEVVDGIAYDSYNVEHGKWSRDIVGETIVEAIDNMIVNFIADHFELYGDAEYVNYKNDRVKLIRDMMAQELDVYVTFNSYLNECFKNKGIDPDNIYLSENVREKFLGPRITVNEQPEKVLEGHLDNTIDLEAAIAEMTASLLDVREKEEQEEPNLGDSAENVQDSASIGEQAEESGKEEEKIDEVLDLLETGESDFTLLNLSEQAEKVDPKNHHVLGLNSRKLPLNPLEYLTPRPSANLRRLDGFNLSDGQTNVLSSDLDGENGDNAKDNGNNENIYNAGENPQTLIGTENGSEEVETEETHIEEKDEEVYQPEEKDENSQISGDALLEGQRDFGLNITVPGSEELLEEKNPDFENPSGKEDEKNDSAFENKGEAKGEEKEFSSTGDEETPKDEESKEDGFLSKLFGEDIDLEQENSGAVVESIFGESLLKDILQEYAKGDELVTLDIKEEENNAPVFENKGDAKEEEKEKEFSSTGDEETPKDEESKGNGSLSTLFGEDIDLEQENSGAVVGSVFGENLLKDILQEYAEGDEYEVVNAKKDDNGQNALLRELQDRRAAEIAKMDANKAMDSHTSLIPKTEYYHIPTPEEIRLTQLEKNLENSQGESHNDAQSSLGETKSLPIKQGEAEQFLTSVVREGQSSASAVFDANIASAEAVEGEKSPAAKKIEEMLAALNERQRNRVNVFSEDIKPVERKMSEQEQRLEEMLQNAIMQNQAKDNSDINKKGNSEIFVKEGENSSDLTGLSSDEAYKSYESNQRDVSSNESRYDAMLLGEYRENPAERIEEAEKEETPIIYEHQPSAEELRLEVVAREALEPKAPLLGEKDNEEKKVLPKEDVKSEGEAYLDSLLEDSSKDSKEETREGFTGFEEILGEQSLLEVASNPQELMEAVVSSLSEGDKKEEMGEEESYLEGLLNSLNNPAERSEEAAEKEETPIIYDHQPSAEELRLEAVAREALEPKAPLLGESETREKKVLPKEYVKSEGEAYLDSLLEDSSKDSKEETREGFTGFEEILGEQSLLEVASNPQELMEAVVSSLSEGDKKEEMGEEESYLEGLLNSLNNPAERIEEAEKEETPIIYEHQPSAEELRLEVVAREALEPKAPLLVKKDTEEKKALPKEYVKSEGEAYLDSLLDVSNEEINQEQEFTGFTDDMQGYQVSENVGSQDLITLSLEDKIRQVAEMELSKNTEERRMENMLSEVHGGDSTVIVEENTTQTARKQKDSSHESYLDSLLKNVQSEQDGEFTGFEETMIEESGKSVVSSAHELFAEEMHTPVSKIEDYASSKESQNHYFQGLLSNIEDLLTDEKTGGSEDLIEFLESGLDLPKKKSDTATTAKDLKSNFGDGEFNGFEDVFFDGEMPESESLAAVMASGQFLPLSLAELTEEERRELLQIDSLQDEKVEKYSFIFGEETKEILNSKIRDDEGKEMTVFDYLEDNNILLHLPEDSMVWLKNGTSVTGNQFIKEFLISNIILNGYIDFGEYLKSLEADITYSDFSGYFPKI